MNKFFETIDRTNTKHDARTQGEEEVCTNKTQKAECGNKEVQDRTMANDTMLR